MWKTSVLCRPLLESFRNRGSECSVWHWGITWLSVLHKGQSAPSRSLTVNVSFLHRAPYPFRAERDACVWASASTSPPFRKHKEEKRALTHNHHLPRDLSVHPSSASSRPDECTHCHSQTAFMITSKSDFVSTAILHSNTVIWTVLQSKSPTATSVSCLQKPSVFSTTLDL